MSEPLRVAMIIQAYYPHVGGAERQLMALVPLLQARGIEINILTRRYPGLKPFEMIGGAPVHRLPIPGPKAVASTIFTLSALPLLARLRPHLIHAHELLSPTTTAVAAKRLFGIPVVAKVLRGGMLGDIDKLKKRRFGPHRLALLRQRVNAFITISKEIDTELAEIGIEKERRPFIPNGVDTDKFAPIKEHEKQTLRQQLHLPEGFMAVFTGRLSPEKRVDQLIAIWPQVRSLNSQAHLIILGTGEQETALQQAAGDGIHFRGQVNNVSDYLKTADLFLLPSSTEGLSNALLEGMASGLACIATKVGGAPDVIRHEHNGWLVPPDQPEQLQEAILSLCHNAEQRTRFGTAARHEILQNYALTATADKLCRLYERLSSNPISRVIEGKHKKLDYTIHDL
jgi:glycosyltransferase involved in cell wall biosynthesis